MPGTRCVVYGCEKEPADRNAAISLHNSKDRNNFLWAYLFAQKVRPEKNDLPVVWEGK